MYTQGYTYALTQLGLNGVKIARPSPVKAIKGLLGGAKSRAQSAMTGMRRKPIGKPEVVSNDKKPGLLSRGAKWALPTAAIGGGVYAAGASDPKVPPVSQAQYGAQYAPDYPGAAPTY